MTDNCNVCSATISIKACLTATFLVMELYLDLNYLAMAQEWNHIQASGKRKVDHLCQGRHTKSDFK